MRILRKALFVALFVPAHALLTAIGIQYLFNAGGAADLWARVCAIGAGLLMLPVLLPLVRMDPDGEVLPRWFQIVSLPVNSLVWAAGILLLAALVRRLRRRRSAASHPTVSGT